MSAGILGSQSIQLSAVDDDIFNEGDERFTLNYAHNNGPEFVDVVEVMGEFIRHTATVIIIDNDCKGLSTNYIHSYISVHMHIYNV